ncbi:hypothetical protein [Reichenbachiella ulvae]|uniref:Prevent-host-death family protein n=1 Tax=Reichenbachiella ulvae TaxID=2980104 RepID=A0ABT3CZ57_9BACT|nr:hypothetical protein [Reichenbachiella ulvae]MCV9388498.1 hypothetical protein [Reichenbachiella ulvae]
MNSIAELKSGLHHYISEIDDMNVLLKLKEYASELLDQEGKVVAYTSDGRALDQKAYKKDIDQAIAESKEGKTLSIEELEKDL